MHEFTVIAAGIPATSHEWLVAMQAPLSEVPALTEAEERQIARLKLNAETKRRHNQMRRLAQEREALEGKALGAALQQGLEELGSSFVVASLQRMSGHTSGSETWFIRLLGDSREVQFSMELGTVRRLLTGSVTNSELDIFWRQVAELVETRRPRSK